MFLHAGPEVFRVFTYQPPLQDQAYSTLSSFWSPSCVMVLEVLENSVFYVI
jgi:hypothetical protein